MSRAEGWRRVIEFDLAYAVFGALPRRVSYTVMSAVAWIVVTLLPGRVAGLRRNLEVVFPDASPRQIRAMVRRNARNYAKFWVDLFRVPRIHPRRQEKLVTVRGEENLREVLAHGRGCVVVAIHMGGWEGCCSYWGSGGSRGYHTALIAEVLEPPALWRRIRALRQRTGLALIPLARTAPREILRRLRDNGIVAGAIDRDILGGAPPRRFFGEAAPIPTGLVEIAQRTGAGVIPVVTLREPGERYLVIGGEPVWVEPGADGLERAMDSLLQTFESWIRRYPDQWHVMTPIFRGPAEARDAMVALEERREVAVG
jgi:KDO2-lipid IV(A) lauroyltransferase